MYPAFLEAFCLLERLVSLSPLAPLARRWELVRWQTFCIDRVSICY